MVTFIGPSITHYTKEEQYYNFPLSLSMIKSLLIYPLDHFNLQIDILYYYYTLSNTNTTLRVHVLLKRNTFRN